MGLEPTTLGTTIRCSNQLSYMHHLYSDTEIPSGQRLQKYDNPSEFANRYRPAAAVS